MNDPELAKHRLTFDRPHLYKCECGFEVLSTPTVEEIWERPKSVEYLPCGHAVCAMLEGVGCLICANQG